MERNPEFLLEKVLTLSARELGPLFYSHPVGPAVPLNESFRIVVVEAGEAEIQIGTADGVVDTPVPAGGVVIGLPGAPTGSSGNALDCQTFALCFLPEQLRIAHYSFHRNAGANASVLDGVMLNSATLPVAGRAVNEALRQLAGAEEPMRSSALMLVRAQLQIVHAIFAATPSEKMRKPENSWRRIEAYLSSHPADDLSRRRIAELFRINQCYLSTLCREMTGNGFNEYVRLQRLAQAQLLLELNLTLDEIAERCGFRYTSYFIRVFKAQYGMSPGQYRIGH